jgi:hypothetical protein
MSIDPSTCLTFGPHPPPDSPLRCGKCRTDRHLTIRSIAELRPPSSGLLPLGKQLLAVSSGVSVYG